jgi:hypothetical protein
MGLNRILMKANGSTIEGDGEFIVTLGKGGYQYGFSRYNATIGEVEGSVKHEGKDVTLVMILYGSGYLDFAFKIEGVYSGSYNVTLKLTSVDTGAVATMDWAKISFQSSNTGFYGYTQSIPTAIKSIFTAGNVGKKYRVEIIFN